MTGRRTPGRRGVDQDPMNLATHDIHAVAFGPDLGARCLGHRGPDEGAEPP